MLRCGWVFGLFERVYCAERECAGLSDEVCGYEHMLSLSAAVSHCLMSNFWLIDFCRFWV
jgi:hypothetical protein